MVRDAAIVLSESKVATLLQKFLTVAAIDDEEVIADMTLREARNVPEMALDDSGATAGDT